MKHKFCLAIYNYNTSSRFSVPESGNIEIKRFSESILNENLLSKISQSIESDAPVIITDADISLPEHAFIRLLNAIEIDGVKLCSALSCQIPGLSVLDKNDSFAGTVQQLDHLVFLLQKAGVFETEEINPQCFIVKNKNILRQLNGTSHHACNNLLVQPGVKQRIQTDNYQSTGNQNPPAAHALEDLRWKIKSCLQYHPKELRYPLLDKKPVILHITMDWGGGVHKWINDYCANEQDSNHIILVSCGEFFRQAFGEKLSLRFMHCEGPQIKNYDLNIPIHSVCETHQQYKRILSEIIVQYQVSQIIVSSLIGHSLECLQTQLPTIRVFHDYFPSWPSLVANLDAEKIAESDLQDALHQTEYQPFGSIEKQDYLQLRNTLHKLYNLPEISLVAPDKSVAENLIKIDAKGFKKPIEIIPHAIAHSDPLIYTQKSKKFRILIPGKIDIAKGKLLLQQIIPKLNRGYEFVLLGSGREGLEFVNKKNVTVIQQYENKDLHDLFQKYQPDIALILSQTSETFNYLLSELQQAGICTLSTMSGALKNRIINNETGILLDNNPESFIDKIRELKKDPQQIQQVRSSLRNIHSNTFDEILCKYKKLYPVTKNTKYKATEIISNQNYFPQKLLQEFHEKNRYIQSLKNTEKELEDRTLWVKSLSSELKQARNNISLERQEIKKLNEIIKTETGRLNAEIAQIRQVFQAQSLRLESEIKKLNSDYDSLHAEYDKTLEDKHVIFNELNSVYQSRSWRITKPMRQFTTWARHKRNAIKFRWAQLKSLPTRFIRSYKTRGLSGTLSIIKGKFTKQQISEKTASNVEVKTQFNSIKIQSSKLPQVSIIIPVYNHFVHTYNCLESISKLSEKTTFEVIVIDDCSTDDTQKLIKKISGITYHRQKENGGFIESCNTGAKMAKGQYLMFLNNDTVVYDNWLDSLLAVFETYSDAGLVGSKLVYPNNQLQEAGGIIFSDASGWNYGRLGKPDEPQYNHIREVDYCSGASILIEKHLFEQLGRFDERYKPAYYEDTDLAFAVRNIGKKVYYQPASKVTHFEGISSGTDLTQGTKKYQVVNQEKFKQKWADQLALQKKSGSDIELCRIHNQPKRILIFDACTPTPDQDSGSVRMLNLIKILKQLEYHVIFMPENLSHNQKYTENLQQLGVECIYTPHITNPVDYLKDKGQFLDVVLLSRYYVAEQVMPFIREYCPKAQIIFDTVDLHYVRERRMAELEQDKKLASIAEKTRERELKVAKDCDITLVVSPYEVEVLADELPATKVSVLTNIHEIYGCRKPFSKRKDIMFIGGYQHTPNVDAVLWFVKDILPLIVKQIADIRFHIIGSKAPKEIQELKSENIVFHGFVEDIEPYMDDIRIAVAPLRYGAGVKGKVNMSMSYGQPVVGTKVAVEGMYTQEGLDVLMAETPEEFASQVARLYQDEELWNTISEGGLKNVENYFSFKAAKKSIESILNQ